MLAERRLGPSLVRRQQQKVSRCVRAHDGPAKRDQISHPTVRVNFNVRYRVHSRQLLCIGGSQIPFGWSFLSIAKVPMIWNPGDLWSCEVELQAGQRYEYKYVVLEEQDWTKLENEEAQGLVELTYRTGADAGRPPDTNAIQRAMAIVAWQPGPNRLLQVPTMEEIERLDPRRTDERGGRREGGGERPVIMQGQNMTLDFDAEGQPVLTRFDAWSA